MHEIPGLFSRKGVTGVTLGLVNQVYTGFLVLCEWSVGIGLRLLAGIVIGNTLRAVPTIPIKCPFESR